MTKQYTLQDFLEEIKNLTYFEVIMRVVAILLIGAAVMGGCNYVNRQLGLSDDNMFEETIENKIADVVGIDVDLTPDTKE